MFRDLMIKTKLIIGFLGVTLLVGIVGYTSISVCQETLQRYIEESSVSLVLEALDKIDRNIYSRIEVFHEYSKRAALQRVISKLNQEFDKLDNLQAYIDKKDQEWISTSEKVISAFMQRIMNNEISRELKELIEFYEQKYGYRVFGEAFITSKYGTNIAQSGRTSDYYQADEEWWQSAKKNGLYRRDIEYDKSANVHSVDIGIRINDEAGNFLGVMKIVLNVKDATNIVKKLKSMSVYETAEFNLLTKDGKVIYSSKEGLKFFENEPVELLSYFEEKEKSYFLVETDRLGTGKELFAYAHSKGFRDYESLGWILIVRYKAAEMFAPVYRLKNVLLLFMFVVLIIAFLIGLFIAHSISKPIIQLKEATTEIGKGKLGARMEIKSKNEVGQLADSFNRMAASIKESKSAEEEAIEYEKGKSKELKKLKDELELKVTERTKELKVRMRKSEKSQQATLYMIEDLNETSRELKISQEQVVRSEKLATIGKLAGIISHELRNPLGVIRNGIYFLNMRLGKGVDKKVKKHLDILQEEINTSDNIITDILNFAHLRTVARKDVNVNDIIEKTLAQAVIPKNIKVQTDLAKNLPRVCVDVSQIKQVFFNIISNANQAMSAGGKLKITTTFGKDSIVINISDTGCGIEKQNLNKIFDPLFSTKAKGIGLGLSTCWTILDAHIGTIEVESQVGKGSLFVMKLPVTRDKGA